MRSQRPKTSDSQRLREILAAARQYKIWKEPTPEKLFDLLCELGPTFIKMGQILSMRQDLLPEAYCNSLAGLRDKVQPMPLAELYPSLNEALGRPWKEVFERIVEKPLGSASIAQVHGAVLAIPVDGYERGEKVVIKIQRPGIFERMERDISLMRRGIRIAKCFTDKLDGVIDLDKVVQEVWRVAQQEMDFICEADHMERFHKLRASNPNVISPLPLKGLTTRNVLIMTYYNGIPIDRAAAQEKNSSKRKQIGHVLVDCFCEQVLEDGYFQADPHPGNLMVYEGKILWLDLGMMGELLPSERHLMKRAVAGAVRYDTAAVKDVLLKLALPASGSVSVDHVKLYDEIEWLLQKYATMPMAKINVGEMFRELIRIAEYQGLKVPDGVTMLGRSLLTMQGTLALVNPEADFMGMMRDFIMRSEMDLSSIRRRIHQQGKRLMTAASRSVDLPINLSVLLEELVRGRVQITVNDGDANARHLGRDLMADRLATAIVIAGLLISSAILLVSDGARQQDLGIAGLVCAIVFALVERIWAIVRRKRNRKK